MIRLLAESHAETLTAPEPALLPFLFDAGQQIAAELSGDELADFCGWLADSDPQAKDSRVGRLVLLAAILRGREAGDARDRFNFLTAAQRTQVAKAAARFAEDSTQPLAVRAAGIRLLTLAPAESAERLAKILAGPADGRLQAAVAEALADRNDADGCRAVYRDWELLGTDARRAVIAASLRSPAAIEALLDAVKAGTVRPVEVPIDVAERLKTVGAEALRERALALFRSTASTNRRSVVEQYLKSAPATGSVERGAALFRENCLTCHTVQRVGKQVGPELSGLSSRPREIVLHDILDPSARISADYLSYTVVTKEGKTVEGLIVNQSGGSVRLRRAGGEETVVPTASIEQIRASEKSLMPDGFETKISPQAMGDLLAFLRQPSRDLLQSGKTN